MIEQKLDKVDKITNLRKHQMKLIADILEIAMKPKSVYAKVNLRRTFKMIAISFEVRSVAIKIKMIKEQPMAPQGGLPIIGGTELNIK